MAKLRIGARFEEEIVEDIDAYVASSIRYGSRSDFIRETMKKEISGPHPFQEVSAGLTDLEKEIGQVRSAITDPTPEEMDYKISRNSDRYQSAMGRLDEIEAAISGLQPG